MVGTFADNYEDIFYMEVSMIRIDKEKKEIHFMPDRTDEVHPPERTFPLLSSYICPFCRKVLAAYFQGRMSEADAEYYQRQEPHYRIGSAAGGHYIKLESHQGYYGDSDRCTWEEYTRRGIVENLRLFVQQYELPGMLIQLLSRKIRSIPGFCVVEDVCGKDQEMLLFSEDRLFEDLRRKDFDAYWKAKEKMGEYLTGLLKDV